MKSKSMHGQLYWDLERPSVEKKIPNVVIQFRPNGRKGEFYNKTTQSA
jgi:hypothetical protein